MCLRRLLQSRRRRAADIGAATNDPLTELALRMHAEFVRPDFLDRLAAFHGLGPTEPLTSEHFASFDAYRRDVALRAIAAESGVDGGIEPGPDGG